MSSDDSEIAAENNEDQPKPTEVVELGKESGVAAKAKARAQARESDARTGREFTISARAIKRAVVGIVAVAVIAVACVFGWKWYDTEQELAAFDDAKTAASHYVTEYFTVLMKEGSTADELREAVGPLSTGDQKKQIESSAPDAVQFRDTQKLSNVQTKVNTAMVESFSTEHAVTVVGFEFTGTSATAPGGGKFVSLMQLTLDKVDGQWLVSRLDLVPGMAGDQVSGEQTPAQQAPADESAPAQPTG
ncbi:hypothetical protein [Gordonia humi]|uniref:Mce-associated membrane protein n=1 Tax=Gordonia humi TaxID=686429 RepID=A0A840F2J6_9ACTN|nr:hypothetical protein [Gordonia humi]MBB4136854.1 Mce-associated membrane protein [Gordonia humi]